MEIVAFGADAHRQNVIGVVSGFVPGRRERDVTTDEVWIGKHFDPREAVGIGPDWVVDAREVNVEFSAAVFEQVRQQERHLVHREWILSRPGDLVPHVWMRWGVDWPRHEFVPG